MIRAWRERKKTATRFGRIRRRGEPETEEFARVEQQTRSLAFLIDLIVSLALFCGLGGHGLFLVMPCILFRDGIYSGQSIGEKVMGIQVVHTTDAGRGTGQNTAPIVKCHSDGDSPALVSSFHP